MKHGWTTCHNAPYQPNSTFPTSVVATSINHQFLYCANHTSEWAWRYDEYCITNKNTVEQALYDALREETDLTANLIQKGIHRAIDAVTSGVEKLKQGKKTSQPSFDS